MPLKTRLRLALGRSSPDSTRASSAASSTSTSHTNLHNVLTITPSNVPAIILTKTSTTSSRLSKITSWRSKDKGEKGTEPKSKYPALKNSKHQEILRGFEMKFGRTSGARQSLDGRWSIFSGVSPMASRNGSLDLRRESVGVERRSGEDVRESGVEE
jgi:hypothetical protein